MDKNRVPTSTRILYRHAQESRTDIGRITQVTIEGEPRMHVKFDAQWISDGLLGTAMHAVNAISYVCDSPAGIKTLLDLPWMVGRGTMNAGARRVRR